MANPDPASLLFVPLGLKALVQSDTTQDGTAWDRGTKIYGNLNALMSPDDGASSTALPQQGVHLFWTMPKALTTALQPKGAAQDDAVAQTQSASDTAPPVSLSGTSFPFVPNRFLVMRMAQVDGESPTLAAWVLNTDELDDANGRAPFVNPFDLDGAPFARPIPMGVKRTLQDWQDAMPADAPAPFVTAVGPGDMMFSAFAPGNENVFSFVDDLSDVANQAQTLEYCVVGWFSDPQIDPLSAQYTLRDTPPDWALVEDEGTLEALGYAGSDPVYMEQSTGWATDTSSGTMPTQTIVHGAMTQVAWSPGALTPLPDQLVAPADVPATVKVAVADTVPEALAALIADSIAHLDDPNSDSAQQIEAVFAALQTKLLHLLDDPAGQSVLADALKRKAYGPHGGGIRWEVLLQETDNTAPRPAPLTQAQTDALAELNGRQQKLNQALDVLWSMKWRLFALWWTEQSIADASPPNNQPGKDNFDAAQDAFANDDVVGAYLNAVTEQMETVVDLAQALPPSGVDAGDEGLRAYAQEQLGAVGYEMKPVFLPRYFEQSDPVVLIAGAGTLPTPQPAQVMGRTGAQIVEAGQAIGQAAGLNPAGTLSAAGLPVDPCVVLADLQAAQAALAADPDAPVPLGLTVWHQPYAPLRLDWTVEYFYAYKLDDDGHVIQDADGTYQIDMDSWSFDGSRYQWVGQNVNASPSSSLQTKLSMHYSGSTPLSPHATGTLAAQIQSYLGDYPDLDIPDEDIAALKDIPILTQSLSGLTSGMVMRDMRANVAPSNAISAYVMGQDNGVPNPKIVPDLIEGDTGAPYFFPIRGGFCRISSLRMIDSFGRSVNLMASNNGSTVANPAILKPILPAALQPPSGTDSQNEGLWTAAPRLSHPARLDLRFVDATDDTRQTGYAAGANPVAGFLLSNHLDQSIAVYDPDGLALGEVQCFEGTGGTRAVQWLPAPGGTSAPSAPLAMPDLGSGILQDVVASVFGRDDNGAAFLDLLETVDQTAWTIDPKLGRSSQDLSVLLGTPVAVVRANVQVQLRGLPEANLGYAQIIDPTTGATFPDTGGIFEQTFPVRLGDLTLRKDGVIGYYLGAAQDTYDTLFACQKPCDAASGYVVQADASNYPRLRPAQTPTDPSALGMDATGSAYVTLLLDPRAGVHVTSGLLPQVHGALPDQYVSTPLSNMVATFQIGPVLTDVEAVRLPRPAGQSGQWQWVQPTGTQAGDWRQDPLNAADGTARLPDQPPILRDGWLKLIAIPDDTEV